jgi:hypothetical protein
MKLAKGLFLAVFTSTILALMLSFLPTVEMKNIPQGVSVFKNSDQPIILNTHTVPDLLLTRSFHQAVKRIQWQPSILTVDFSMDSERTRTSEVYKDLFQVVRLGFAETSNVKEVLARVYIRSSDEKETLAIAMIAKKDKVGDDMNWDIEGSEQIRQKLETMFDITYKSEWRELQN